MHKNKNFKIISLAIFFVAEIILGIFIQKTSGTAYGITTLSSVVLSCAVVGIFYRRTDLHLLTLIALITTVCADFFLCGLIEFENDRVVAMVFFCVTQICYFLRIYANQKYTSVKRLHLIFRITLPAVAIIVTLIVLKENANSLAIISMFYFANLVLNVVYSFIQFKIAPLFAIGLLLFSFCDVLIGLNVLGEFMTIPDGSLIQKINDVNVNLAWVFYVPSQSLIATDIAINEKEF